MEAIKIIQQYWEQLKRFGIYAQYCAEQDMSAPACRDFWSWTLIAVIAIGLLITFICFKRIIKDQIAYYRHRKHLEARAIVADEETMAQHKWIGDDHDVALSQEDLAAEIRKTTKEHQ